jgi:hypothetical protein
MSLDRKESSMYRVEQEPFGIRITLGGFIEKEEISRWAEDVAKLIKKLGPGFSVFVDMRELSPLPADAQEIVVSTQANARASGMLRAVHIHKNPVTILQMRRLAKESGIYDTERFIDASADPNWEQIALDWLLKGIDPDELHSMR